MQEVQEAINRAGSVAKLARVSELTPAYICMLRDGKRKPSLDAMASIQTSTNVDMRDAVIRLYREAMQASVDTENV